MAPSEKLLRPPPTALLPVLLLLLPLKVGSPEFPLHAL
jgi:hypothetical protein